MSEEWKKYSRLCLFRFIFLVTAFVSPALAVVTALLWQNMLPFVIFFVASLLSLSLVQYFGIQARKLYTIVTPEEILGPNWQLPEEEAMRILEDMAKKRSKEETK